MKTLNIGSVINEIEKENEARSWQPQTRVYWQLNAVVNGYGLNRKIPAQGDYALHGATENDARAIVSKLQRKGIKTTLAKVTTTIERLV